MAENQYPDYVQQMLEEAERLLVDEDDPGPCEAAAVCFDILALFPEHEDAHKFIQRAYRDGNLIRDNRRALSRLIDEWDDRPWQQRRRRCQGTIRQARNPRRKSIRRRPAGRGRSPAHR